MRCVPILAGIPLTLGILPAQQISEEMLQVAAAYAAKVTASATFVSGRTVQSVLDQELSPTKPLEAFIKPLLKFDIDRTRGSVTCTIGTAQATAITRSGLGCVLQPTGSDILQIQSVSLPLADNNSRNPNAAAEDSQFANFNERIKQSATEVDLDALRKAVDKAFIETDLERPINTRAIVVVHKGKLLTERYAESFDQDMPLPGWSMTKTMTNALIGMRVMEGKLKIDDMAMPNRNPVADMPPPTIHHLLTMTAGLAWSEDYDDPASDVLRMLFASSDHAGLYKSCNPNHKPGAQFQYASGATNLLCSRLRDSFTSDRDYWRYPSRLFEAIGMRTAVLEADPSGTFVGSSYGFASARDWARFGLFYLRDGVCGSKRLLPEGWVKQSTTPTPPSRGRFGYQTWLNRPADASDEASRKWPDLPADLFSMDGHEGQYCVMSPTAELVIVRLGCSKNGGFDLRGLLSNIHAAVRNDEQSGR